MLKAHWKMLVFLLILTLLWRVPTDGVFFHGLEYEDSYIYTVAGRQMLEHVGPTFDAPDSPYSISVCEVGSLRACQQWEPFREHLIGYPYVISVFSHIFGYGPSIGSVINIVASCLTVLLVFLIALLITDDPNVASLAGLVFAITPVFAVYGLETSAEPFSNVCIILVVWLYLRLCDSDQLGPRSEIVTWIAFSATLLLSQTVKRENILLALIMPIMLPFMLQAGDSRRPGRYGMFGLVLLTSGLAVILSVKMHLLQTLSNESELLQRFPTTPERLTTFVVAFLKSFIVGKWYGGTVFAVVAGVVVAGGRRRRALLPVVLLAAYALLYAIHIRSYYEMESGRVEPQTALRFSMNFMALWAIVAGVGIGSILTSLGRSRVWSQHKRLLIWILGGIAAALLVVAFLSTVQLRDYEIEDERISRLTPALSAVHLISREGAQSEYVVAMEPLVIQMYAEPTTRTVDLESVDSDTLRALVSPGANAHLIFVKETDRLSDVDLSRYGGAVRYLLNLPFTVLQSSDRFQILSLDSSSSH